MYLLKITKMSLYKVAVDIHLLAALVAVKDTTAHNMSKHTSALAKAQLIWEPTNSHRTHWYKILLKK